LLLRFDSIIQHLARRLNRPCPMMEKVKPVRGTSRIPVPISCSQNLQRIWSSACGRTVKRRPSLKTSHCSLMESGESICLSCLTGKSICLFLLQVGSLNRRPPPTVRLLWRTEPSELPGIARRRADSWAEPPSSHTAQRAAATRARRGRYRESHYAGDDLASHWHYQ
jgi:hypothetical protein